jgi:YVTN family beta-propeller protein
MRVDHPFHHVHLRPAAAVLAVAMALVLGSVQVTSAATLSRSWQAKVGAGSAAISAYTNGAGTLALNLKSLKASTTYATVLYRGTCTAVGKKLMALASIKTSTKGAVARTSSLTAAQVTSITNATSDGATIAIRMGTGSITKCGVFAAQPVIVARIAIGEMARGFAADGSSVWATNMWNNTVSRINPATNTVTATIPVGDSPGGVASDGTAVWVANFGGNSVSRIDPATNAVTATIPVGQGPEGVAVGGGSVWVANADAGTVNRIDPATNSVTATIPAGIGPTGITFGEGSVWVTNWGDGTVARIDPATNTVVASIFIGSVDCVIAGGGNVWVSVWGVPVAANGSVARIDPATNTVTSQVTVGYNPTGLAILGDSVYVALLGDTNLVQVRAGAVAGRVAVGMKSYGLAVANGSLWVLHPVGSAIGGGILLAGGVTRINL